MPARMSRPILTILNTLDQQGKHLALVFIRTLLAVEFGASGWEKLHGENWFAEIQHQFPWPFNLVPVDISWGLATWVELLGAVALLFGLGTRFVAISFCVLTWVATMAVHWPSEWHNLAELAAGYAITDKGFGNYKLPLIYGVLLLPLLTMGAGNWSMDYFFRKRLIH
jgi:putative oxidoreductase